ncbi:MAG TPA: PIN domain-containing protein [Verrucomicrobiae bacterium]|nr:PIN domain-containing protein [Verrucomicrobiae bacterium]
MKHLLDTNVLLAALIETHPHHPRAFGWIEGKEVVLCPLVEMGFLRIGSLKKTYGIPLRELRKILERFKTVYKTQWIADDLPALDSKGADKAEEITDHYLADLAGKHGFKLATFDEGLTHAHVEFLA